MTGWLRTRPSFALVAFMVLLIVIGRVVVPGFLTRNDFDSILVLSSLLSVASLGQTLVIVLGGVDLSIAGTVGLGEVAVTVLTGEGWSLLVICLLLIGTGVVIGILNGGTSALFRVHPLIVSLGVGFVITGGVLMWTHGGAAQGAAPAGLSSVVSVRSTIGPIPVPPAVAIWAGLVILALVFQRRTRLGRELYALGSNSSAATFGLCRRRTVWIAAFIVSAWSGEAAGLLLGGFTGGADFGSGANYLFLSIAAVVVGGTSLLGGDGGVGRTVLGSITVMLITTILVGVGASTSLQETFLGVFIILAVAFTSREASVRSRI